MERTHNLDLPYIMSAQAQKHVTHNEALRALDALVQLAMRGRADGPPADPSEGERWIVGESPADAWAEVPGGTVAAFQDGAWTFLTPRAGWLAWVDGEGLVVHDGEGWLAVAPGGGEADGSFGTLGVNATAEGGNRFAVAADASLFTHDGGSHRLTINRAQVGDTGTVLFQSGWSGRAEMGLAGDDDWRVKVSADGARWHDALHVDAATGAARFPNGTHPERLVPAVAAAGGESTVTGPPNLVTVASERANIGLDAGTLYLSAMLVDRPTEIVGALVAQYVGAGDAGAVMRAGIYGLGAPTGNSWQPGPLVADLGALAADAAGHREFVAPPATVLAPGWYLMAVGTNGADARVRLAKWHTPGLQHYFPRGEGAGADISITGPGAYMRIDGVGAEIAAGLPADWGERTAVDVVSTTYATHQIAVPRWRRW